MSGNPILLRLLLALGSVLLAGAPAGATPVQPNVKKLLLHPPPAPEQFAPARAGWKGPETAAATGADGNPMLEMVRGKARVEAMRESLRRAVIPDQRALAAVVAAIFIARRMRERSQRRQPPSALPAPAQTDQLQAA